MYLMDGSHRIMISKALNESDRLSGCSKGARRFITRETPFNVFSFQTVGTTTRGYFYDRDLRDSLYRTGNGAGYAAQWDYTDRNFGYQANAVGRTRRVETNRDDLFLRFSSDPKTDSTYLGYRAINISGVNYDWKGRLQNWDEEFQYRWNFKRDTFFAVGALAGYERLF